MAGTIKPARREAVTKNRQRPWRVSIRVSALPDWSG